MPISLLSDFKLKHASQHYHERSGIVCCGWSNTRSFLCQLVLLIHQPWTWRRFFTKILNLAAHYDSIFSLDNKGSHCCWKFSLAISYALKDCIILQASQPFIKDFPRENQFAAVITIMQTDLFLSDEQTTNFKLNVRLSFVVNWSIDQNQLHHMSL